MKRPEYIYGFPNREKKIQIYFIDSDPNKAVYALINEHISLQIKDVLQLLCNAHRFLDGERYVLMDEREKIFYKVRKLKNPWNIWGRERVENYLWLSDYLFALMEEYKSRFNKPYKKFRTIECQNILVNMTFMLQSPPHKLKEYEWTNPPLTIPTGYINLDSSKNEEYSLVDIVNFYRYFYILSGKYISPYEVGIHSNPPSWLKEDREFHQILKGND